MTTAGTTLIVSASVHHHNTDRVAQAMAETLGADRLQPADCSYERLAGYDLLGLGSGIYYGRVHEELWRWVVGMPTACRDRLRVFIFTTSGLPFLAWLWHRPLKSVLADKGYRVIGEFACPGFDTWGPLWLTGGLHHARPDARDLARAREFAAGLGARTGGGAHA
jgi:flavodoxin